MKDFTLSGGKSNANMLSSYHLNETRLSQQIFMLKAMKLY